MYCFFRKKNDLFVLLWIVIILYTVNWMILYSLKYFFSFFFYICIIVTDKLLVILPGRIYVYHCEMIIILYILHLLIRYLPISVCFSFSFELLKLVCLWLFYKKRSLIMFLKWLLSYIQSIKWLIIHLLRSVFRYFSLHYYRVMFVASLQEVISLHVCELMIILYLVHWLISAWLRSINCIFLFYFL